MQASWAMHGWCIGGALVVQIKHSGEERKRQLRRRRVRVVLAAWVGFSGVGMFQALRVDLSGTRLGACPWHELAGCDVVGPMDDVSKTSGALGERQLSALGHVVLATEFCTSTQKAHT